MNLNSYYDFKWWQLFLVIAGIYLSLAYMINNFVLTDSFYYSDFSSQLNSESINKIIELNKKFQWISYLLFPILLLVKWIVIAGIIFAGVFLFNQNISYKDCFKIVVLAELVLVVVSLIKVVHFLVYEPANVQEVQSFYPLSIIELLNSKQLPSYLIYPLQQLNLFEFIYWLLIAAGIKTFAKKPFGYSLKIVVSSYGLALGICVICVVFIQLQLS